MQGGERGDANALFGVVGGGRHGVIAWIGRRRRPSCLHVFEENTGHSIMIQDVDTIGTRRRRPSCLHVFEENTGHSIMIHTVLHDTFDSFSES